MRRPIAILAAIAFVSCTPAERAKDAQTLSTLLTEEQAACLVVEHYAPTPKAEAAICATCNVVQDVGMASLAVLRMADANRLDAGVLAIVSDASPKQ